jgi:hypothetical protein
MNLSVYQCTLYCTGMYGVLGVRRYPKAESVPPLEERYTALCLLRPSPKSTPLM